jgi:hypothetical protein
MDSEGISLASATYVLTSRAMTSAMRIILAYSNISLLKTFFMTTTAFYM